MIYGMLNEDIALAEPKSFMLDAGHLNTDYSFMFKLEDDKYYTFGYYEKNNKIGRVVLSY